jgi:chloramphenicol 3-O-phosphotransferase
MSSTSEDSGYHVKIVMRDGMGQTRDDYHATITRLSDGLQLISISDYRWLLGWRTRRKAIERSFARADRHQEKLDRVWMERK